MAIKNKTRFLIAIIIVSCLVSIFTVFDSSNNPNITITPITPKTIVRSGEVLSLNSVCFGKEKSVLKEDAKKYLTKENYKDFLDNKNFFKHDIENGINILVKDIVNINK